MRFHLGVLLVAFIVIRLVATLSFGPYRTVVFTEFCHHLEARAVPLVVAQHASCHNGGLQACAHHDTTTQHQSTHRKSQGTFELAIVFARRNLDDFNVLDGSSLLDLLDHFFFGITSFTPPPLVIAGATTDIGGKTGAWTHTSLAAVVGCFWYSSLSRSTITRQNHSLVPWSSAWLFSLAPVPFLDMVGERMAAFAPASENQTKSR